MGETEPPDDPVHHVLDPRSATPERRGRLLIENPDVQRLGLYPDISAIHSGDILLFAPLEPDAVSRIIIGAQRNLGFSERDACWTHAAVYLRAGLIVEAVVPNVRTSEIWPYVPKRLTRVRRARSPKDPHTFGYRLALEMATRIGESYERSLLWRMPFYHYFRRGRRRGERSRGLVYCSQIIADSFAALREGEIYQDGTDLDTFSHITPAHLSHSTILEDVLVPWHSIR